MNTLYFKLPLTREATLNYIVKSRLLGHEVIDLRKQPEDTIKEVYLVKTKNTDDKGYNCIVLIPDDVRYFSNIHYTEINKLVTRHDTVHIVGGTNLEICNDLFDFVKCKVNLDNLSLRNLKHPKVFVHTDLTLFSHKDINDLFDFSKINRLDNMYSFATLTSCPLNSADLSNVKYMDSAFACAKEDLPRAVPKTHKFCIHNSTTYNVKSISYLCSYFTCKNLVVSINTDSLESAKGAFSQMSVDSLILDIGTLENVNTSELLENTDINDFLLIYLPDDCDITNTLLNYKDIWGIRQKNKFVMQGTNIYVIEENANTLSQTTFNDFVRSLEFEFSEYIYIQCNITDFLMYFKPDIFKRIVKLYINNEVEENTFPISEVYRVKRFSELDSRAYIKKYGRYASY